MTVRNGTAAGSDSSPPSGVLHQPHVPSRIGTTRSSHFAHQVVISGLPCSARSSRGRTAAGPRSWAAVRSVAAVPPRTPAARAAAPAREDVRVAEWRRTEIFEWLYAEGPKTIVEIRDRFDLASHTVTEDIRRLRFEGRLQRTGRERQGPRGGHPSPEFLAVEADGATTSHAQTDDAEAEQPAIEAPPGDAADAPPERSIEGTTPQGAAAVGREAASSPAPPPITVYEQLVVRYVGSLIGWIERSSIVRDQGPPEHVYDRIERLLQIQDGVA